MEKSEDEAGHDWIQKAIRLVLDALRASPDGLTNVEVAAKTGLDLTISNHNGYITWTILQYLVESGQVKKDRRTYRLARTS